VPQQHRFRDGIELGRGDAWLDAAPRLGQRQRYDAADAPQAL
jgi:hypothetical protein